MSHKPEDMMLLLLLINVFCLNGGEACIDRGNLVLTNNTRQMKIEISLKSGRNITVIDTAKRLLCESTNNSCYIECSFQDFFANKNFTSAESLGICVENVTGTRADFILENTTSACTVVDCMLEDIAKLLESKESQMKIPNDLGNIPNIKKMCYNVISNFTLTDTYLRVEKKAIYGVVNMTNSTNPKVYSTEDISLTVVNVNLTTPGSYIQIDAPSVFSFENPAKTWIPMDLFKNHSQNKIGLVTYDSDDIFKLKLNGNSLEMNRTLVSKVIRIEVPGYNTTHLSTRVNITFPINNMPNKNLSCEYYSERRPTDEEGEPWKTDGCETELSATVTCSCDHMTPFAVLLTEVKISKEEWRSLSYITYIGCSLSAFFSAVTVLSYLFSSNARAEVSSCIHVSLSGALFLLNMSFMFNEVAAQMGGNEVCVFVAVTIHYSLLSSFTWMAVEALHLYLLLIRVFNIYIRHYMAKLSLIGWGIPALIVGGLLSAYSFTPFYGVYHVTFSDTNSTTPICWMTNIAVLYGVNLSYFSIVFLFNLGILITVSRQICKLRHLSNNQKKKPLWKDAGTVLGLMCLMGTTWGLAFFSAGNNNLVILWLFSIFNTMQGFGIFLWMCATARKNRERMPQSNSKSTLETSKNL